MKRFLLFASALLLLASCAPKSPEAKVMARAVPERSDDFVFENNLIAGRFYGKALEGNPTSPGLDIWVKLPGRLVANEWYANEQQEPDYYHHDHGGKDCYKVAVSLGGGASAPFIDGTLRYPATNYRSSEILSQTGDEVSFVLHYPEWEAAEGVKVSLDKTVTLKADSYFADVEDVYTFTGADSLTVAAGVKLHGELATVESLECGEAGDRWIVWEKASDQSVEPEDGRIGVAVILSNAEAAVKELDHALLLKTVVSGQKLRYTIGNCWSKGEVKTVEQWKETVAHALPYQNPALSAAERAEDLLGRLTIDQKAKLMTNYSFAIPELGIRAYNWWSEALHGAARAGLATSFPQAIGMAASWDVELLQEVFDIASTEQRIKFVLGRKNNLDPLYHGLTVWTPNINIFRDPRWGRGQETYGEDPFLTARMGEAVVNGLQGQPKDGYDKLHACLKHYAVHSGLEYERHHFDVSDISMRDFRETYLYAFEDIISKTDVQEVMCAYNSVFGKPCCNNDQLLTRILREEWGYQGLVVSDCSAIRDLWSPPGHQPFPGDPTTAISHAVRSGTDLECGQTYRQMANAIREGKIDEKDVDVSLRRLLRARFRLGEMDPEESVVWNRVDTALLDCPAHQAVALKMAHESMVLLMNKGILPLSKEGVKYAVVGPNAKDEDYPLGNYKGTPAHVISAFEGICNAVGETNVTEDPAAADIVIYVGGINPRLEGEEMPVDIEGFFHGDRTSIELPKDQRAEIASLKEAGKKVVYVNMSGSAMALVPETQNCEAILQAWYAGEMAGKAIADVLYGEYNPSGKLPVTFYASDADLPDVRDYKMEGRTYRYFYGEPLWYFGYGLSYTTFEFGEPKVKKDCLTVEVTNTGEMDGDEVVQVYVTKEEDADGPKMALRAFKRVSVPAGKTVKVRIPLSEQTWAAFDESAGKMTVTPGHFTVWCGNSADPATLKKTGFTLR